MMRTIPELQQMVESHLKQMDLPASPMNLYSPFRYMLDLGGKRMRPVCVLMGCELYNDEIEKALPPATGIELFHNFTLVHDDIMDKAPIRRGKTTVHKKFNTNIAILTGDVMMIHAYNHMLNAPGNVCNEIMKAFNQCAVEVCEGQQYDLDFENTDQVSIEEYIEMIRLKTAVLLGTSFRIGALSGGASISEAEKLYAFGEHTGIAFQLQDDMLDTFGDEKKFGKQVGGDILQNKKTYLLIKALEKAEGKTKDNLSDWLHRTEFNPREKVNGVKSIYENLEVEQEAEEEVKKHFNKAIGILNDIDVDEERKVTLRSFADKLMVRKV